MRTFPTKQDIEQFRQRAQSGQFTAEDLDAFYKNPHLWRPFTPSLSFPTVDVAQAYWQLVWDELALEIGGRIIVPPVPRLTDKQRKSINNCLLLFVYIPALSEDRYPACFVKPEWGKSLAISQIERVPLKGRWIAVETVRKPDYDDEIGYPSDRLATMVKFEGRFEKSWDDLNGGLLEDIARSTGFPKAGTRLPSAEEWNLLANLFNWLREHRAMDLPDLGSTRSVEWCGNAYKTILNKPARIAAGHSQDGGLASITRFSSHLRELSVGFRVLFEL